MASKNDPNDSPRLEVLFAISTLQPIRNRGLYRLPGLDPDEIKAAVEYLALKALIEGDGARGWTTTAKGTQAVSRAGFREARDVSRMLYLWNRQRGRST